MPNRRMLIRGFRYALSSGRPGPDLSWITDLVGVSGTLYPRHFPFLAGLGVKSVVDLRQEAMHDTDLLAQNGIRYLRLPTVDHHPPTLDHLAEGARWVFEETQAGRMTVAHCKEGIGRSVCVVCCALMMGGYDLAEAVSLVKSRRWGVALNPRQLLGLDEFEKTLSMDDRPQPLPTPATPRSDNGHEDVPGPGDLW